MFGGLGVVPFLFGQVAQELAHTGVGGSPRGGLVKPLGLQLHHLRLFLDRLQSQRPHQPDRAAADETANILPANQRYVFSEALPIKIQQAMPVRIFIAPEVGELLGLRRIIFLQGIGKIVIWGCKTEAPHIIICR